MARFYFITYEIASTKSNLVIAIHPLEWLNKCNFKITLLFYKEISEEEYEKYHIT